MFGKIIFTSLLWLIIVVGQIIGANEPIVANHRADKDAVGPRLSPDSLGYIFKGRVRVKRSSDDEVLQAGDVYYLEPGRISVLEEDTDVLEFSSKAEYQKTIEVAARNIAACRDRTSARVIAA